MNSRNFISHLKSYYQENPKYWNQAYCLDARMTFNINKKPSEVPVSPEGFFRDTDFQKTCLYLSSLILKPHFVSAKLPDKACR